MARPRKAASPADSSSLRGDSPAVGTPSADPTDPDPIDAPSPSVDTPIEPTEPSTPLAPQNFKRKRGRPSKAPNDRTTPLADDLETASDIGTPQLSQTARKRRGRPPQSAKTMRNRGGPSHVTSVPLDKDGNPQTVEGDEIVLVPDPAGEQKVDKYGYLQGGREYRCRTFTLLGRGQRLYMLSTEPARCIGFRDSYLFFQKHKQLFKIITDEAEKFDMISRNLIPHSYKGRAIGVVTARSVFREFGARIVVGGRKVTDDYWEARERAAGVAEGELADPEDKIVEGEPYNRNQYVAWHGASSVYHTGVPSVPVAQGAVVRKRKIVVTDTNWMLEHARAASQFNTRLLSVRAPIQSHGVYEPHTNLVHFPSATQPTRTTTVATVVTPSTYKTRPVVVTEAIESREFTGDLEFARSKEMGLTGFGDWDENVLSELTIEERAAIKAQAQREKDWMERWGVGGVAC